MKQTPDKVYVYDVVYGAVPLASGTDSDTRAAAVATSSTASANASETQSRQISQRGEKKRIFEALSRSHDPCKNREDWATDYTTVSLEVC